MRAPRTLSPETLALLAAIPQSSEDVHLILRGLNPRRVWRALLCFCPEPAYLYWRSLLEQCNPYSDEPLLTAREICSIVFRCEPRSPVLRGSDKCTDVEIKSWRLVMTLHASHQAILLEAIRRMKSLLLHQSLRSSVSKQI